MPPDLEALIKPSDRYRRYSAMATKMKDDDKAAKEKAEKEKKEKLEKKLKEAEKDSETAGAHHD